MNDAIAYLVEFAVLGTNSTSLLEAVDKFDRGEYNWQDLVDMCTDSRFGGVIDGLTVDNVRSILVAQI